MSGSEINDTRKFIETLASVRDMSPANAVYYFLDIIDNKTSSLLTHVSIMMAVLSVFYVSLGIGLWLKFCVAIEIFGYLLITLGCLRSIYIVGRRGLTASEGDMLDSAISAVVSRRKWYRTSLTGAMVITLAFLVTAFSHFVTPLVPLISHGFGHGLASVWHQALAAHLVH